MTLFNDGGEKATKVWLITGCSSGFGFELACEVLARGEHLVATARDTTALERLAEEYPETCRLHPLDVTDAEQVANVARAAFSEWGRLDVLVNNAGNGLLGAIEECSPEEIRENMETNFFGPLAVVRAVLPYLREQRSGHIVNISAAAAISNYPGFGIYGGAKAALELACESLRAEVAPLGVRVTLVQPGPFKTRFITALKRAEGRIPDYEATSGKFGALLEKMNGRQPGDPKKAAEAIVAMVQSGEAPFRLPLGKYVLKKIKDKAAAALAEAEKWQSVAEGTESTPGRS